MPLSAKNQKALNDVARKLGIPSRRLYALISFESNFNPKAINPKSRAAGLIQFMPKTAKGMGYVDQYDLIQKFPTISSQLAGPVYDYLKRYKPYFGDQSLFMAVFYPKARTWPAYRAFPAYVRKANPGINNPGDYTKMVYRKAKLTYIPPLLILIGITGVIYYYTTRKAGKNGKKIEQGREPEET